MPPEPKDPESQTAQKLLEAAEQLFAQKGWAGASIREITQAAGVNVAAAHYHFGSKEALLAAVLERHLEKLMGERLALLDEAERDGPAELEDIVRAFVLPVLAQAENPERGACMLRLMGRTFGDPDGPWRSACESRSFEKTRDRFCRALGRCCPHLSMAQIHWRMQFLVGSLVHLVLHGELIAKITNGVLSAGDLGSVREELIAFLTGGLAVDTAESPLPPRS